MKNNKKPHLRFKGFNDDWEQRKLGDCGWFKSNGVDKLSKPNEIPVNLLNYVDIYNKRIITNKNTFDLMQVTAKCNQLTDNNVLKGDVFFTPTSETADDIGHSKVIEETLENTVYSYHLMRYRPYENMFYLTFPNFAFDNSGIYKQMALLAQGVQRFVLSKTQFESIIFRKPSIKEQEKISNMLGNLDNLIALHQRKYEKLVSAKKALLDKMFPKNFEKFPKIRFKGFFDAWEQRKLNDVIKNQHVNICNNVECFGKYVVVQQGNEPISGYTNDKPFENYKEVVLFGDHTLSLYKPKQPFLLASDGIKAFCADNVNSYFLYCLLEQNLPKNEGYKRYSSILKNEITFITLNNFEQAQIGNFFYTLDNLIALHQRKGEKLKNLKKALLEQMFV